MARAKVLPQNRKRIVRACQSCRLSKRRCNGAVPCSVCVRRRISHECSYSRERGSPSAEDETQIDMTQTRNQDETHDSSQTMPSAPTGHMFLGSNGERVYINNTSGLSLLHFLKITLKQRLGPSRFTSEAMNDSILEYPSAEDYTEFIDCPIDEKKDLIECYFIAVRLISCS